MSLVDFMMNLLFFFKFYAVGAYYSIKQLFWNVNKSVKFDVKKNDRKNDQRFLAMVTGGTKGIGLELAKLLTLQSFDVILVARNQQDGIKAIDELKRLNDKCRPEFYSVDLADEEALKKFIENFMKKYQKLHLLVNNAAMMMTPYTLVKNKRYEIQWGVNVVALVYITEKLLGLLKKAGSEDSLARVINLSSSAMFGHRLTANYWSEMPGDKNHYSKHLAYANSKVAVALYTKMLQKRLDVDHQQESDVTTYSMHPGVISTDLYQHLSLPARFFFNRPVVKWFLRQAQDAAWDMLYLCLHDEQQLAPGQYYENCIPTSMARVEPLLERQFEKYIVDLCKSF